VSSPQTYARVGGILYLFIVVAALFGEAFVRGTLIDWSDPTATARSIIGSETLFRAGLVGEMATCACDVTLALILYALLEPIDRHLALLGAFFRVTFVAVYAVAKLFEIAALVVLGTPDHLRAFQPQQLYELAHALLRVHSLGYGASLLFFGFCCIVFGELIRRSVYFPKILGWLLIVGGVGYVLFSSAQMLAPAFSARVLFPWLMLPAFPAEVGLAFWLTIKGVNLARWTEMTRSG
jgi:hypothetical protein